MDDMGFEDLFSISHGGNWNCQQHDDVNLWAYKGDGDIESAGLWSGKYTEYVFAGIGVYWFLGGVTGRIRLWDFLWNAPLAETGNQIASRKGNKWHKTNRKEKQTAYQNDIPPFIKGWRRSQFLCIYQSGTSKKRSKTARGFLVDMVISSENLTRWLWEAGFTGRILKIEESGNGRNFVQKWKGAYGIS